MRLFKYVVPLLLLGLVLLSVGSTYAGRNQNGGMRDAAGLSKGQLIPKPIVGEPDNQKLVSRNPMPTPRSQVSNVSSIPIKHLAPFGAPLAAGTYHVGTGGDYTTFSDAVDAVQANGVSGPVVLELTDASYTSPVYILSSIPGASATNTVTITAKSGVDAVVTFTPYPLLPYGFVLADAHWVILDGTLNGGTMHFQLDEAAGVPTQLFSGTVCLAATTTDVTVKNMIITSSADHATWSSVSFASNGLLILNTKTSYMQRLTIDNNKFGRCYYGILSTEPFDADDGYDEGGATNEIITAAIASIHHVTISNNHFGAVETGLQPCAMSIAIGGYTPDDSYIMGGADFQVFGNRSIGNEYTAGIISTYGTWTGSNFAERDAYTYRYDPALVGGFLQVITDMGMLGCDSVSKFHDNVSQQFHMAGVAPGAIYYHVTVRSNLAAATNALCYNNVVSHPISSSAGNTLYAIRVEGVRWINNTVAVDSTLGTLFAARPRGGTLKNNIFYAGNGGTSVTAVRYDGGTMNHNLYARGGAAGTYKFRVGTGSRTNDMATYIAGSGQEANGTEQDVNPGFVNERDNLQITGASMALNLGESDLHAALALDAAGAARPATTPTAGAYQVTGGTAANFVNTSVVAFVSPVTAGIPNGLPAPVIVRVKNYDSAPASIDLNVTVTGSTVYNNTHSALSIPAYGAIYDTFPTFTPSAVVTHAFHASITSGGGTPTGDDSKTINVPVIPAVATYPQLYDFNVIPSSADSATGNITNSQNWVLSGDFYQEDGNQYFGYTDKLDVPYGGTGMSLVTEDRPTYPASSYNVQKFSAATTPYFDTRGQSQLYISFYQNLNVEPVWDRSFFQYTVDTGKTWHMLGRLNDPDGTNWYNTATYENAGATGSSCFDDATWANLGIQPAETGAFPAWTSNGSCSGAEVATGPNGWIFCQLKLPDSLMNRPMLRFRYGCFSDGATTYVGWAFDNFFIGPTGNTSLGSVSGTVYNDINGNGTKDPFEVGISDSVRATGGVNTVVYAPGGVFTIPNVPAGGVTITADHGATTSVTEPYPSRALTVIVGPGEIVTDKNIGLFNGGITGHSYVDNNANGANNTEPGAAGFTYLAIPAADDSAFRYDLGIELDNPGSVDLSAYAVRTATSAGSGDFFLDVKVGDYVVAQLPNGLWKNTQPAVVGTQVIPSGPGATKTVNLIGFYEGVHIDSLTPSAGPEVFGNFKYGIIKIYSTEDLNGDGIKQPSDRNPLPIGTYSGSAASYSVKKNGLPFTTESFGGLDGVAFVTLNGLEFGSYKVDQTYLASGFTPTLNKGKVFNIYSSGFYDSVNCMAFKNISISGSVFEDQNGDANKNVGEPNQAGWTVNLTGPGGLSLNTVSTTGGYSFSNLGPGTLGDQTYTITETVPAGYTGTKPLGGSYSLTVDLTHVPSGSSIGGKDFGNFTNVTVSGTVYKDDNQDGVRQSVTEAGLSLSGEVAIDGGAAVGTGPDGSYSFADVGPGQHIVSFVTPAGYLLTAPLGGADTLTTVSATNVANVDCGLASAGAATMYRTFTADQLGDASNAKPVKHPKKAPWGMPNFANVLFACEPGPWVVGVAATGKGSITAAKQKDVFATFNAKGVQHSGASSTARGLDFDVKGKAIVKGAKSLGANKKNDILIANMMALQVNLLASSKGLTTAGFGDLLYNAGGSDPLNGLTIQQISNQVSADMSTWGGIPYATFAHYNDVVSAINAAFATTGQLAATDTLPGWAQPAPYTLGIRRFTPLSAVPFLHANPNVQPVTVRPPQVTPFVPAKYALNQNYPNPFNPTTTLSIDLPNDALVTLKIFNILGQEVATLYNNTLVNAGVEEADFDASRLASGVYIYRLEAQSVDDNGVTTGQTFTAVKKMMLVK